MASRRSCRLWDTTERRAKRPIGLVQVLKSYSDRILLVGNGGKVVDRVCQVNRLGLRQNLTAKLNTQGQLLYSE